MEKKFKRTTVTSALPYANGPVHIGHLAGVYVPADIYVRYLRLKKEDVLFIGGSDEHGVPITIRAKKEGVTPQDVVDRYHYLIKKSFEEFGVSFDVYSRTTSKTHHQLASDFFKTLYNKGEFIEKTSEQYYDEEAKTFRPLYHRRVPSLPFGRRLWRPMREMRNFPVAHRPDQPQKRHQRQQACHEGDQTLVSSSRQTRRLVAPMDSGRSQRMASQRIRTVQKLARYGIAATCRKPRPRLGYSCAR